MGLAIYFQAYTELATCRLQSGNIPWTAVNAWAIRYELDDEQAFNLLTYIPAMNEVWHMYQDKKNREGSP